MNAYSFTSYTGHRWTIGYTGSRFVLQDDDAAPGTKCKYWVKVEPDHSYTFKIMKTKIKAKDGAAGLFDYIKECYTLDIMECMVEKIIDKIITGYVKAA